MNKKILIGLVGNPSSGKDTAAAYLVEKHNFIHISTGDMIRFYIAEHNLGEPARELMQKVANILRTEHGQDYLVKLALENESEKMIISGIRNIGEAEAIKAEGGSILAIDAPIEIRYKRAGERGRVGDGLTFEEFKKNEEKELANTDPNAQNVSAVLRMADFTIINNGSKSEFEKNIDQTITKMLQ